MDWSENGRSSCIHYLSGIKAVFNRQGGPAYQAAFYVFDEIAQLPSANNVAVLNAKACAQGAMGNWPEADAALVEASQIVRLSSGVPSLADWTGDKQNPDYAHSLANSIALTLPSGKASSTAEASLEYVTRSFA